MQCERERREYTRRQQCDPSPSSLQAKDGVVEGQERGFGAPQTDVDEEQADPGCVEEMCGEVGRHAVVECLRWRGGIAHAQMVFPNIDADQDAT